MRKSNILLSVVFLLLTVNICAYDVSFASEIIQIENRNSNNNIELQNLKEPIINKDTIISEESVELENPSHIKVTENLLTESNEHLNSARKELTTELSTAVEITEDTTQNVVLNTNNEGTHYGGCLPTPKEVYDNIPKVPDLPYSARNALPSKVDLSQYFPIVGDQGRQNSCVGWATAYYLKTAHEQMERKWGVSSNNHIFSPSYVYNQINGGVDNGAFIYKALDLLKEQGVCTIESMPYYTRDYRTQPNIYQEAEAGEYKIFDYAYISGSASDKVNKVKNELNNNNPVIIGVEIYPDLDSLSYGNRIYDTISGSSSGGHALCVVGYDDSLKAFKFINSWGGSWGLAGYGYISYDLLSNPDITNDLYVIYDLIKNQHITLNKSTLHMDVGESFTLTANVNPATPGVENYTWKSSNTSVATVNSSGEVVAKSKGNAKITVSEKISGKSASCNLFVYNKITVGSIESDINKSANDSFKVYIRNVKYSDGSSLDNVSFSTWTEKNGQDDIVPHKGTKIAGTNDWVVTIKISEHKNEIGKYITQVYTERNGQRKILGSTYDMIENKVLYDEIVKENVPVYGNKYKIIIKNVRYSTKLLPNKVLFPTWTTNNGQDDIKWYEGTKISGTNDWEITINIADHNKEAGKYLTHIYTEDTNGQRILCKQVEANVIGITSNGIKVEDLSEGNVKITVNNVKYSDNTIPNKVMFPTWTINNGQDDIIWHEGTRVSGTNNWEVIINKSQHKNEFGMYTTHVYARPYDNNAEENRLITSINYDILAKSGWTCINSSNTKYSVGDTVKYATGLDVKSDGGHSEACTFKSSFEVKPGDDLWLSFGASFLGDKNKFDSSASICSVNVYAENGERLLCVSFELTGYQTKAYGDERIYITDETAGKLTFKVAMESTGTFGVETDIDELFLELNGYEV